jgi:hypothetical protein
MIKELEEIRAKQFEYCKNNIEYFIENYVYIEDPDNKENILQLFKLWEKQKEVLINISIFIALFTV